MIKSYYLILLCTSLVQSAQQVISHQSLNRLINDPKGLISQSSTTALPLFDVIIFNDTVLLITVIDTIILLDDQRKVLSYQLKPSEQTPQMYVHQPYNQCIDRSIRIIGSTLTGTQKSTWPLIIGNDHSADYRPKGRSPSGVYSITQDPKKQFNLSATTQKDVSDAGSVMFSRSLQLWDVSVHNDTPHILYIIDLIDGPQLQHIHRAVIQPTQSIMLAWDRTFTAQRVRKIIIWGPSLQGAASTNKIIISNTLDSTYLSPGGSPGGIYTIKSLKQGTITLQPAL